MIPAQAVQSARNLEDPECPCIRRANTPTRKTTGASSFACPRQARAPIPASPDAKADPQSSKALRTFVDRRMNPSKGTYWNSALRVSLHSCRIIAGSLLSLKPSKRASFA